MIKVEESSRPPAPSAAGAGLLPGRACCVAVAGLILASLAGCHRDMYDQPRYDAYSESTFFKDGTSFRPLVQGTIARGQLREDSHRYRGKDADGKEVKEFPYPVTEAVMERGRERFMIFCSPCHGASGDGLGMIVKRGMSPPPSFHIDRLKQAPEGHFFNVISNGYGKMYRYDYRVPVDDRWAIIAYVRALQYRGEAKADDLPKDVRTRLEASR
ncbi:cytochrome c [Isosphaeraceae bacterium EP7]